MIRSRRQALLLLGQAQPGYLSLLPTGRFKILDGVSDGAMYIKSCTLGYGEEREEIGELAVDPASL